MCTPTKSTRQLRLRQSVDNSSARKLSHGAGRLLTSDDRTGGNANKVDKAKSFFAATGEKFKIVYLADGPGLCHKDTWQEACTLDGEWDDNVRVTTLKLAPARITTDWLLS